MRYALTGATGQLGRLVINELKRRVPAASIMALARDVEKARDLGVPTSKFDYNETQNHAQALAGIDALLLISSNAVGQRAVQHRRVIEAARAAGVGRVVYTSLLHADTSPLNLAQEHRETEQALIGSGLPYTILRNGWYIENYTDNLGPALAHHALLGSAGEGMISGAARSDYALAAAVALTGDGHANKIYELAGDVSFTLAQLAQELSHQTGRAVYYRDLPEQEYAATLSHMGVPQAMAASIAHWDRCAAQGVLRDESATLSRLIGQRTTPWREVVRHAVCALLPKA